MPAFAVALRAVCQAKQGPRNPEPIFTGSVEIRGPRRDLRHRGFHFAADDPDFVSSNRLTHNVRLPPLERPVRIDLSDYPLGSLHRVARGPIELLLRRKSEDQVEVWPSLCPHEGGLMDQKHFCDGQVICPWQGRASPRSCSEREDATSGAISRSPFATRETISRWHHWPAALGKRPHQIYRRHRADLCDLTIVMANCARGEEF
jgi:hypothetical protein